MTRIWSRAADVVEVPLERELGRVDADRDETVASIPLLPRANVGKRAQPVDTRVCPEVDDDDLAAETLRRERRRVEPRRRTGEAAATSPRRADAAPETSTTIDANRVLNAGPERGPYLSREQVRLLPRREVVPLESSLKYMSLG